MTGLRESALVEIHGCGCATAEDLKANTADAKFVYENQWVEVSPTGKATVKGKAITR